MLQDRNIAFFIDVDNVGLSSEQYADIIERLGAMGSVLAGKIYGAGERKHKEIYADADLKGYATVRPMRVKRRGRKDFDARIFVDVVDAVTRAPSIDAVCIVAQPTDLVHLYSYLRGRGVKVIALANADEASCALIDEVLDIPGVTEAKPEKKPSAPKKSPQRPTKKQQPTPTPEPQSDDLQRTDELLQVIKRLQNDATPTEEATAEEPNEQPTEEVEQEPAPIEEVAEPATEEPTEQADEQPTDEAEPTTEQPTQEQPTQEQPTAQPRPSYTPSNERDLIRRIEEIRKNNQGNDDDLVDEIRKLLDGLDD